MTDEAMTVCWRLLYLARAHARFNKTIAARHILAGLEELAMVLAKRAGN